MMEDVNIPKYRLHNEKIPWSSDFRGAVTRSELARDVSRIKFSDAFRRLQHKAQVYSHSKGDHFRTRLTHTIEVHDIALSIANSINTVFDDDNKLDLDLVQAISLAHDIGHAPFGHEGERALNDIMSNQDSLGGKLEGSKGIECGGFKHNYHGLRVLTKLERKTNEYDGINIDIRVLEGVLRHTSTKNNICISEFINNENQKNFQDDLYRKYFDNINEERRFSYTIEGQIVAISDEIAQRQHDIDDGLRDAGVNIDIESIIRRLKEIPRIMEKELYQAFFNECIESDRHLSDDYKENPLKKDKYKKVFIRDIADLLIIDCTNETIKNLKENSITKRTDEANRNFVEFSSDGKNFNNELATITKNRILNSFGVNRFDGKAKYVITQLFKAYFANFRQMPQNELELLFYRLSKCGSNAETAQGLKPKPPIFFLEGPKDEVTKHIELIKDTNSISHKGTYEYQAKRILMRTICDYIAGMTDNYAINEYKELY